MIATSMLEMPGYDPDQAFMEDKREELERRAHQGDIGKAYIDVELVMAMYAIELAIRDCFAPQAKYTSIQEELRSIHDMLEEELTWIRHAIESDEEKED